VLMIALALQSPLFVVAIAAFFVGISLDVFYVVWITTVQRKVPRDSLSRVMSYDAFGSLLFGPLGLIVAGPLIAGAGPTIAFGAFAAIAAAAVIGSLMFRSVRSLTNSVEMQSNI